MKTSNNNIIKQIDHDVHVAINQFDTQLEHCIKSNFDKVYDDEIYDDVIHNLNWVVADMWDSGYFRIENFLDDYEFVIS